jgi:hypothetical protein
MGIRKPKFSENRQQLDIIGHAGLQSHPRPRSGTNKVGADIGGHAGSHTCTGAYSSLACLVHFGTHSVPCPFGVGVDGILSAAGTVNPRVSAVQLRRRPHGDGPHSMLISLATRAPHQIIACQAGLCIIGACLVRNVRLDGLISVDSFRFIEFDRVFKLPVIWLHRIWLAALSVRFLIFGHAWSRVAER